MANILISTLGTTWLSPQALDLQKIELWSALALKLMGD
jgi:hypothetical protein